MKRLEFIKLLGAGLAGLSLQSCMPGIMKFGNQETQKGLAYILENSGFGNHYLDQHTFNGIAGNQLVYLGSTGISNNQLTNDMPSLNLEPGNTQEFRFAVTGEESGWLVPKRFAPDNGVSQKTSLVDVINTVYKYDGDDNLLKQWIKRQYKQFGFDIDTRYLQINGNPQHVESIRYTGPNADDKKLLRPLKREWTYEDYESYTVEDLTELKPEVADLDYSEAKINYLIALKNSINFHPVKTLADSSFVKEQLLALDLIQDIQEHLNVMNKKGKSIQLNRYLYDTAWYTQREEHFEIKESHRMDAWNSRRTARVFHLTDFERELQLPLAPGRQYSISIPENVLRDYDSWAYSFKSLDGREATVEIPMTLFLEELKFGLDYFSNPSSKRLKGINGTRERFTDYRPLIAPNRSFNPVIKEIATHILKGLTDNEDRANWIVDFVQKVPYVPDLHSYKKGLDPLMQTRKTIDKFRFPLAILTAQGDDCEGQAVLMAALAELADLENILIYESSDASPSQMASNKYLPAKLRETSSYHIFNGIAGNFPEGQKGFVNYKGTKYYFADGTNKNWTPIGEEQKYKDLFPLRV